MIRESDSDAEYHVGNEGDDQYQKEEFIPSRCPTSIRQTPSNCSLQYIARIVESSTPFPEGGVKLEQCEICEGIAKAPSPLGTNERVVVVFYEMTYVASPEDKDT
jgi:hypothetical protein